MNVLGLIWTAMRPKQWTKNLLLFVPIAFAQKAGDVHLLLRAGWAVVLFSGISSCAYIVNDFLDLERDRAHPEKCRRPLASGALRSGVAFVAAGILGGVSLTFAFLLSRAFGWTVCGYCLLSIAYSVRLKHYVIIDVMTIAMCFVLRVVAGAVAVSVPASSWLFLCTILLALFLGFGKRRHELALLDNQASQHRAILKEYSPYFLDQMMSVVTASTVVAYSLYTISPDVEQKLGTPYLYLTIPFVLYGIFRYLYLIHQKEQGGNPSSVFLSDGPLFVNVVLWAVVAGTILYVDPH